jgi:malate dehydrogenase
VTPTPEGDWHSVALCSKGEYDIAPGIITSFPVRTLESGVVDVAKWVPINDFSRTKINATVNELLEERELVKELL